MNRLLKLPSFRIFWISVLLYAGCKSGAESTEEIVATVGNKHLYTSELEQIIHPSVSNTDSISLANAYTDQWIRDQLLMREANKSVSSSIEIEHLVADYREKLIKYKFENQILEERFDQYVSEGELNAFHENNKERFVLNDAVFRCQLAIVSRRAEGVEQFNTDWRKGNTNAIITYVKKHAINSDITDEKWHTYRDLSTHWSDEISESRLKTQQYQRQTDGDSLIFVNVLESKEKGDLAPLGYIANQLSQMILLQRRQKIIEDYKTELYEKAVKSNQVTVHADIN